MAGAIVEHSLGRAILSRLRDMTDSEQDSLLDGNGHGALATFSTKIWVGYGLNLYGQGVRADLLAVKKVRNKFAHEDRHLDFRDPEIERICERLQAPRYLAETEMRPERTAAKERYLDTIHHFAAGFSICARTPQRPGALGLFLF